LKTHRLAIVALSALGAASLAVGGCSASNSSAQSSPSGSDTVSTGSSATSTGSSAAQSALIASMQQLNQTPYRYHLVSGGLTGAGAADPASKAAKVTMTGTDNRGNTAKIEMIALNTDFWLRLNLGNANQSLGISTDKWLHLDAARLGAGANLPVDPSGGAATANALFSGLTDVQQVDSQHFTGSVDLTKATGVSGIDRDMLSRAGVQATSIPFTATLDGQGRLSDLKLDLSSIGPGQELEVSYSDYGSPVTVTKPDPSQVAEAPDSVYQFFARR
jgi:hypothetical protein